MQEKKIISNIPEPNWLKELAPDACLNVKDIGQIFNIKPTTLDNLVRRGEFPKPDLKHIVGRTLGKTNTTSLHKRQWRAKTIRKYFKENRENGNS
jgi:hypothetical protein